MTTTATKAPQTGWPPAVRQALRQGKEALAVQLAIRAGERNENQLTNLIFFHRHPERNGALLQPGEPGYSTLAKEWIQIRDTLVRPALAGPGGAPSPVAPSGCEPPLEGFELNKAELKREHLTALDNIARRISDSFKSATPIRNVRVIGHTDPSGTVDYNRQLGQQRADAVKQALQRALKKQQPGSSLRVEITAESMGEARYGPNDAEPSRRVEVCLSPTGENRWLKVMGKRLVRRGNRVVPLVDGPETFRAMAEAIRSATGPGHYIYLLGWWLDDNLPLVASTAALPGPPLPAVSTDPNSTMRALLASAAYDGVQVRAMLWNVTYPQSPKKNKDEVARINGLPGAAAIHDSNQLFPTVGSQHQKMLIVQGDRGLIAFCGGIDINHDRVQATGGSWGAGTPYHDVHCSIRGPAVLDMLDVFHQRWFANPEHRKLDAERGALLGLRDLRKPPPLPQGPQFVRIGRTFNGRVDRRGGGQEIAARSVQDIFLRAIAGARRFIYIEDQFLTSLCAAAALNAALPRIQHLTILIPATEITDLGGQGWHRRGEFIDRLRQGPDGFKVAVYFLVDPRSGRWDGSHTYVHSKLMIVDDELALIGSPNLNRRSWETDAEVVAAIFDHTVGAGTGVRPFAQRLRMRLWAEHLNLPPASPNLVDGVRSATLWETQPGRRVRLYNPAAGRDWLVPLPWNNIDPPAPLADAPCCRRSFEPCGRQP